MCKENLLTNNRVSIITKENKLFGQVRFAIINEKEYAVGKDVAKALGYKNYNDAISTKCKAIVKHDNFKEGGHLVIYCNGTSHIPDIE